MQKILRSGHLFRWTGTALELRDEPQRFIEASLAVFASHAGTTDSVRQEVRRLAELHFTSVSPVGNALAPSSAR